MNRITYLFLICFSLLCAKQGLSQDTNQVKLHIQLYSQGICIPMMAANSYSTSKYRHTKSVLQSGAYYSNIFAFVNSPDSAHLNPTVNHQLQSSSVSFNPELDYELVIIRYEGFNRVEPDSMVIKISKLKQDAQLIIPFKKGHYALHKMDFYKPLKSNTPPNFKAVEQKDFKIKLKLDSTAYFPNGDPKAKYYQLYKNYPLYYVVEFDPVQFTHYSQGLRLVHAGNQIGLQGYQSVWASSDNTKYGYWEYYEDDKVVKHEMWASFCQGKYEWYPAGQLKSATELGQSNKKRSYTRYLENGKILEDYQINPATRYGEITVYSYSSKGVLLLKTTHHSSNGITKQGIVKRALFYPSGQLKIEENFIGTYTIKYFNEDGSQRIK